MKKNEKPMSLPERLASDSTATALYQAILKEWRERTPKKMLGDYLAEIYEGGDTILSELGKFIAAYDRIENGTATVPEAEEIMKTLARHSRDWFYTRCSACEGTGECDGGSLGAYGCPFCADSRQVLAYGSGNIMDYRDNATPPYTLRCGLVQEFRCQSNRLYFTRGKKMTMNRMAVDIVKNHPVGELYASDLEPEYKADSGFLWERWDTTPGRGARWQSKIPPELFAAVAIIGGKEFASHIAVEKTRITIKFTEADDAKRCLARALAELARAKAGFGFHSSVEEIASEISTE